MKTGAEYAFEHGADGVIFVDSDGQHDPDDLTKFIGALQREIRDCLWIKKLIWGFHYPIFGQQVCLSHCLVSF